MATNYYAKKFASTTEIAEFLNFGGATLLEYGTGYISGGNLFTAVTQNVYPDWTDLPEDKTVGYLILSGQVANEQFTEIRDNDVASASSINMNSMTNIGSASAPVAYRIYSAVPTFPTSGSIEILSQVDSGFLLVWKNAAPVYFS